MAVIAEIIAALNDEISAALEGVRPLADQLLDAKKPLVAIENERAKISRALGGKTGLFDHDPPGDVVIDDAALLPVSRQPSLGQGQVDDAASEKIRNLEAQSLQVMEALQLILQTIEDERAKREKLQDVVLKVAEEADGILRRAG